MTYRLIRNPLSSGSGPSSTSIRAVPSPDLFAVGQDLLEHAGMVWLREIAWLFESAIFDGERARASAVCWGVIAEWTPAVSRLGVTRDNATSENGRVG